MATTLPAELQKPLAELKCQIERLHARNCALLTRQDELEKQSANTSARDDSLGVETLHLDAPVLPHGVHSPNNKVGPAWSTGNGTSSSLAPNSSGLEQQASPNSKVSADEWHGWQQPKSMSLRPNLNKDQQEIHHPSVKDDPGVMTLAGSRLGLLGEPPEQDGSEPLLIGWPKMRGSVHVNNLPGALSLLFGRITGGHLMQDLASSTVFKGLSMLAIALNTLYIASSADHQVKQSLRRVRGQDTEEFSRLYDICFAGWFTLELLVRIAGEKMEFFNPDDIKWNIFDAILVFNSIIELLIPGLSNFSFLRILRVCRLVRVVRIVRTVKALRSLRTMVFALMNSFVCLMWAFAMIFLIMTVFGIIFEGGVASYLDEVDISKPSEVEKAEEVALYFSSMTETLVSLFSSITGGDDWMVYGRLLRQLPYGDVYLLIFLFYIGFCVVGMLNVVTGIFVDSAVCTRTDDEVVECFKEDQRRTCDEVRRIFKDADVDCSGTLSLEELVLQLENPWVKAYFSGLDIDPSEARIIFTLIDTDGSDAVSIDEFVDGTMKLKGHAKALDLMALMYDQARFTVKFNKLCSYVEDTMRNMQSVIDPTTTPKPRLFRSVEDALTMQSQYTKVRMQKSVLDPGLCGSSSFAQPKAERSSSKEAIDKVIAVMPRLPSGKLFGNPSSSDDC